MNQMSDQEKESDQVSQILLDRVKEEYVGIIDE